MKGISDLLDSDVENSHSIVDENSILSTATEGASPTSAKQRAAQPKKTRKRKCVTMPKPKSRVVKASPTVRKPTAKKAAATKRKALEEQVNSQAAKEDDTESEVEVQETQSAKPRGRPATKAKPTKAAAKQEVMSDEEMEVDQTPAVARSSHAGSRPAKHAPKVTSKTTATSKQTKPAPKKAARAPQQDADVLESDTEDAMQLVEQPKPPNASSSRMRQEPSFRRRAGSASDTERGDPNLRRKLGDVTRRFENVDLKYRNLKEVGVNEANMNMEKLRKQCEATTQASNELIASLKKELAMQAPLAQDARKLKKQIQGQEAEAVQLRSNNTELSAALIAAQNEIKSLQAKLAAARSSSVAAEGPNSRTPGRDIKPTGSSRTNAAIASEAAQHAQMKEELYSDLTGLIVRSVKRGEDGDTYDCIQTGRNGSKWISFACYEALLTSLSSAFQVVR
jgi:Chromosome segregation protein Csm1/Pcs1